MSTRLWGGGEGSREGRNLYREITVLIHMIKMQLLQKFCVQFLLLLVICCSFHTNIALYTHRLYSSLEQAVGYYSLMSEVHLSVLSTLASQASVVTDVTVAMSNLLPLYRTTFSAVQSVFLNFVEQAGRFIICAYSLHIIFK